MPWPSAYAHPKPFISGKRAVPESRIGNLKEPAREKSSAREQVSAVRARDRISPINVDKLHICGISY